ncbi:MAG: hypothetical protein ACRCTJ_05060 [Brevinema sp.]
MALEHMFQHVQNETKKEAEEQINSVKVAMAKKLIAYGEDLEKAFNQKKEQLTSQIIKKEEMLKVEQEFQHKTKLNAIENIITDEILDFIKTSLLEFVHSDNRYPYILSSWFKKAMSLMQKQNITIRATEHDQDTLKTILDDMGWHYTFEISPINAGFVIIGESGECIDLSFNVLFQERKEYLLQTVMNILKEKV